MRIKLVVSCWLLYAFGCASRPIVSFSIKNINGSALTCLKSEVPEVLDLDKMVLTKEQKAQCFLEQCRIENGNKICTTDGNPNIVQKFVLSSNHEK